MVFMTQRIAVGLIARTPVIIGQACVCSLGVPMPTSAASLVYSNIGHWCLEILHKLVAALDRRLYGYRT